MISYWPLLGVAVVVAGFAIRLNPMPVVVTAGLVSCFAAGKSPGDVLALLGTAFIAKRSLLLFALTFPVIGVLERAGLRERARAWIVGFARLTLAGLLIAYLAGRQLLAMVGLWTIAGHPQTVRPLLAPMCEATAARRLGALDPATREQIRAFAAATDNVGLFFGEDVFLAFSAVVIIQEFYRDHGIGLDPFAISIWALPTAGAAFVIHAVRILWLERRIARRIAGPPSAAAGAAPSAEEAR